MTDLKIVVQPIAALRPRSHSPRTHTPKQIQQIADSIARFGFTNPVLVDDENGVIAGAGRLAAAASLGRTTVPTVRLSGMTEAEIRAYVIADNKLAENAGWDRALLGLEFQYLEELDFDLSLTGFEAPEIDILIGEVSHPKLEEDVAPAPQQAAVTRAGDIWRIGEHNKLICGDSLKAETYIALLGAEGAQMVFCDAPYNVKIDGHVSGGGKHREFEMASGEMSDGEFTEFLKTIFGHLAAFSLDGSVHFQCIDWRHVEQMMAAGRAAYSELKNICVWSKTNAGMGSLYRSQHEFVLVFKSGRGPHINNVELGRHGRSRSNIWTYAGANAFGADRAALGDHPTPKPVALVADAIRDCSRRGGLVLDPFGGSGTTLIAAARAGRRAALIEIDPIYCDVIVRRAERVCGLKARLEATGEDFATVAAKQTIMEATNS